MLLDTLMVVTDGARVGCGVRGLRGGSVLERVEMMRGMGRGG